LRVFQGRISELENKIVSKNENLRWRRFLGGRVILRNLAEKISKNLLDILYDIISQFISHIGDILKITYVEIRLSLIFEIPKFIKLPYLHY